MPPTSSDHLQFNFMSPSPLMVNIDSVKCSPPAQEVPCLPSPAAAEQETCISSSGFIDTCLPSPAAGSESGYSSYGGSYAGSESTSSSYNVHQSHSQHILQQPLHVSPSQFSNVSPPSSPESDDSVFLPEKNSDFFRNHSEKRPEKHLKQTEKKPDFFSEKSGIFKF